MNPSNEVLAAMLVAFLSAISFAAVLLDFAPAESLEHPEGVSVRNESANHGSFFVGYYAGRSHVGGGLFGGK